MIGGFARSARARTLARMTATDPLVFLGLFRSDRFAELSLNQWMALVPPELVKAHLNLDDATIAALRTDKQVVARP
jgi:oxalate decarboxylase